MKELVSVLAVMALLIGASALAVGPMRDRETFIPPPDAVAEGFLREVATKRWSCAREYLYTPVADAELQELHRRIGDATQFEAETITRTADQALVTVRTASANQTNAIAFTLFFDRRWKVKMIA